VQISGREARKEEYQGVEGTEEGKEVKLDRDTESTSRVLGVPREMVCEWVEGDLEVLMNHLESETGGMPLREFARQGVLEAFVVAVRVPVFDDISLFRMRPSRHDHTLSLNLWTQLMKHRRK
jgi:hypothetical protein